MEFTWKHSSWRSDAINGRLAAVRRLAYETADSGLLSPELAAGIRRVKGTKYLGVRLVNWLTAEGKRDRALLAILLGCGLRRREAAELDVSATKSSAVAFSRTRFNRIGFVDSKM